MSLKFWNSVLMCMYHQVQQVDSTVMLSASLGLGAVWTKGRYA